MGNGFRQLMTTFWIGGMWVVGVLVAPTLFDSLERATAGMVAGRILHLMGWVGIVAGSYLTIWWLWAEGLRALRNGRFWLVLVMLACTLVNQFAVFPIIAGLKPAMVNASEGLFGGGFATWHAISTLIYLLQAVLGLLYVWGEGGR
ncbi:DUF4149 domain-containing protein [Chitinilyticum piscinae]|uniref:DUF4149 domain-containing protein n=1 Tax=Chitinilyticum piscinae TaxID=2866724 RepID=A0A8J7FIX0_9NEIS|nr:DUF4149 domain-containing protein [Chitinilyticum piscinae]MBE9610150.1 DUF4149 domain-containing protein [Chitinilyticum piscinae]